MNSTKSQKQRTKPAATNRDGNPEPNRGNGNGNGNGEGRTYEPSHDEIAALAQRIYEDEGCPEGCADEHWYEAERRLREREGNPGYDVAQRERMALV
jgi:hypothetical protein